MAVYQGNQLIGDLNYQDQNISEGYYGDTLVYQKIKLTDGLLAYYRFESSGTMGTDYSGNNRTLGSYGVGYTTTGKIGNTFNPVTSATSYFLLTRNDSVFAKPPIFSLSLWLSRLNPETSDDDEYIILNGSSNTNKHWALLIPQSRPEYYQQVCVQGLASQSKPDGIYPIASLQTGAIGSWRHFVIVINSITKILKCYYYGSLVREYTNFEYLSQTSSIITLKINGSDPGAYRFNGLIDEVAFWNRELSPSEVTQLYNGGNGIIIE